MKHEEGGWKGGSLVLSFFLGGLIGAGIALLLAPRSGKETREKIKEFAEEVKGKVGKAYGEAKEKLGSIIEKGKDLLEEKKTILTTAIEAGKEAYLKEKEKFAKE
ncbi:MAG: YtxH domain-containing protein [Thermodesulfobacteriota bacterium]